MTMNRVCALTGAEFPLFAFSHCRDVVAAVSKAGGFGVLGGDAVFRSTRHRGEQQGRDHGCASAGVEQELHLCVPLGKGEALVGVVVAGHG